MSAANGHRLGEIDKEIAPRPLQPLIEKHASFAVAAGFSAVQLPIDDVEERVQVRGGMIARDLVSAAIHAFEGTALHTHEIVKRHVIQIELEVRRVTQRIEEHRCADGCPQQKFLFVVVGGKLTGIHMSANLQQREQFVWTHQKGVSTTRLPDRPVISSQEAHEQRD